MKTEFVAELHAYQPFRNPTHPFLKGISTDPHGINWTNIVNDESYKPLTQKGILEKASFDIYQTLLVQLEKHDPETANIFKKAMKENGVGESFAHPILPDLSKSDKTIVIAAGVKRFQEITGKKPKVFWPPETAIDMETLIVLEENGYEGFLCAAEQIIQRDGSGSDSKLTKINLPNGKQIIAYPFDRELSTALGYDRKMNADEFAHRYVLPARYRAGEGNPVIAATDAETFGHHHRFADEFLRYLLNSTLPNHGIEPVSINKLKFEKSNLPEGRIIERSAWSCPHGNLVRWNGSCGCSGNDASWKKPMVSAMNFVNNSFSEILQKEIGKNYGEVVSRSFYDHLANPDNVTTPQKMLVAAKISSLIANTSCATFFDDPRVSGYINIIFAFQGILYLNSAGLQKESVEITNNFLSMLENVKYQGGSKNARQDLEILLNRIGY